MSNIFARAVGVLLATVVCAGWLSTPVEGSTCLQRALSHADHSRSTANAFDFYEGDWTIRMRQRKVDDALHPASDWMNFAARVSVRRLFQGAGFFEEYRLNKPEGTKYAIGTRLYNAKTNQWAIYWANKGEGEWQPPARGGVLTNTG